MILKRMKKKKRIEGPRLNPRDNLWTFEGPVEFNLKRTNYFKAMLIPRHSDLCLDISNIKFHSVNLLST